MGDFIYAAGWAQHSRSSLQHLRSASSSNALKSTQKALPPRPVSKSTSASALHTMASTSSRLSSYNDEDREMSTIPDPRSRAMTPSNDTSPSSPSQHPDLSNEVATLSNKLINAINHQTNLDDTLSATRQELEVARETVKRLELENSEHKEMVSRGILIRKSISENEKTKLVASIMDERRQRSEVEQQKKAIEQELENLSVALFEEAQKMVVQARETAQKDHDIVQKRNDQLKAQLADTEGLLKFQQEQLADLKRVMEQMDVEKDDQTNPTAPSTPGVAKFDSKEDQQDADTTQTPPISEIVSPTYPTSFTHLLQTILRTDLSSYEDFTSLLQMSKNVPNGSRISSGSYGTIGLGLGLGGYNTQSAAGNGSTSSLSTTLGSVPVTPTTPASTSSAGSTNGPNALTPLKETKFYKRALAEDIEPTLRLDSAPGLSWLARRTVLNAVCEGTMVVEPMPAATKAYAFACSLCGETRKDASHSRGHRFRTSENENAQRYPLCRYCLGRVRSTCDFLGFLRILKDGHWRADDEESEKAAWEESVRLREQMFWCRIGGGVVLANHNHTDLRSPRFSEEERKEQERKLEEEERKLSEELERTGEIQPRDVTLDTKRASVKSIAKSPTKPEVEEIQTPEIEAPKAAEEIEKPAEVSKAEEEVEKPAEALKAESVEVSPTKEATTVEEPPRTSSSELPEKKHDSTRDSTHSTSSLKLPASPEVVKEEPKRLSITIPGAFE